MRKRSETAIVQSDANMSDENTASEPYHFLLSLTEARENPLVHAVTGLPSLLPCDHAAVWLAAGTQGSLLRCVTAIRVNGDETAPDLVLTDRLLDAGDWQTPLSPGAMGSHSVLRVTDSEAIEEWNQRMECFLPPKLSALLIAPLVCEKNLLGFLTVGTREQTGYSSQHILQLRLVAGYAALAAQNVRLQEIQCLAQERQAMLDQVSEALQKTLDLDTLIAQIFDEVNKALHAQAQSIWLIEGEDEIISCRFATGPGASSVKEVDVSLGEGIVGKTVAEQKSFLITDAQNDERHSRRADLITGLTTHSLLSVPLVREGKAIGAIQAMNKQESFFCVSPDEYRKQNTKSGLIFTADDMEILRAIADIAALAIENARLYADLQISYDTTLNALTAALDCRDKETEGHCRRVSEYAVRLAEEIGMDAPAIRILRRGSLIHDIGKIGVPDAVLHKPGPLTRGEWEVMQKHPQAGWEMLQSIPQLREEVLLVLTHQERWDGKGYPFGLEAEAIPLNARLFAIVDAFDAILSDRPYRKGRPYDDAAAIIAGEAGRQFDPQLVEAFLQIPPRDWEALRELSLLTDPTPSLPILCGD